MAETVGQQHAGGFGGVPPVGCDSTGPVAIVNRTQATSDVFGGARPVDSLRTSLEV